CVSLALSSLVRSFFFFATAPVPSDIFSLSLHDALPIFHSRRWVRYRGHRRSHHRYAGRLCWDSNGARYYRLVARGGAGDRIPAADRKSTRLNSSHVSISYAVFCLKKKIKERHR